MEFGDAVVQMGTVGVEWDDHLAEMAACSGAPSSASVATPENSCDDGTDAVDATVEISNDNGSTYFKIASTISVPADSTLDLISRPIYLDETDLISVTAGAANDLAFHVSYVELVD